MSCLNKFMSAVKILQIKWYQWDLLKIQHVFECGILRKLWALSIGWDSGTAGGSCHQGIFYCVTASCSSSYLLLQPDRKSDPPPLRRLFPFCSSFTKTRKKKKLLILPISSTKGQASLSASDWKFWIDCSDSCHVVSVQTELKHVWALFLAAVLSWESNMTMCFLIKTFPGIQSHSCNHAVCV